MFNKWRVKIFLIFVAALFLRGAFVLALQDGFYFPDSTEYSKAAVTLLDTGGLGETYHRPPGYPVFLAAIYLSFGENILAIRLVESVVGALLAVLIALIGRRVGGDLVGALAGVLWTIYPISIFIAGLVYPTGVISMLLASGILCLLPSAQQEPSPKKFFLAGIILGLATLTIPIVLATVGAISVWLLCSAGGNRLARVSFFLLGTALIVVPWTIRDAYVYHRFVAVDPRVLDHLPQLYTTNDNLRVEKMQKILNHPALFASHFAGEFVHFWELYPERITMDNPGYREKQHEKDARVVKNTIFSAGNLIKIVSVLSTGPLFFFALIGTAAMWFRRERRHHLSLLCAVILSFAVGYSAFYAKTRYRIPIEPYIVILSAYGLRQSWLVVAAHFRYSRNFVKAEVGAELVK